MKKLKLTKVIATSLIVASVLALNPIGISAEWKQDSNGWWNTEGNSWSIGWRLIDGNWYYFYSNGYMAYNTAIDGYTLDSNGVWIQDLLELSWAHPDSTDFDAESQRNISENN